MERRITKENMIYEITERAGKRVSDHYLRKLIARKSTQLVSTVYNCMKNEEISAKFAYTVLTCGIYE